MSDKQMVAAGNGSKALAKPQVTKNMSTTVEAADIQIPKILLMQGLSDFVTEQRAGLGDLVDSLTAEKLGDSKKPVNVIPICMWKDYVIMEKRGQKYEFKEFKPYNEDTQHWREFENREFTDEKGIPHQRNFRMNFAVLLEREAGELGAFPHVISFQRTSLKAGKNFANFFLKAQTKGQKPWFFTLGVGAKIEKNELGSYYIPTVATAKETQDFDQVNETCRTWEAIFTQGSAKIDERDSQSTAEAGEPTEETRF